MTNDDYQDTVNLNNILQRPSTDPSEAVTTADPADETGACLVPGVRNGLDMELAQGLLTTMRNRANRTRQRRLWNSVCH
jgi:hypothetical protein